MQHSQLRKPNEIVKLFAKVSSNQQLNLLVYEFVNGNLLNITKPFNIENINDNYYSTEIITPDHSCYLVILFCGNPIILRIGEPQLEFFFWSPKEKLFNYEHFNEFGTKLDEGVLNQLDKGFHYTTPVSDVLGYIEVIGRPYVIHTPYCSNSVGIGIDVDWKKVIIRKKFGVTKSPIYFSKRINQIKIHKKTRNHKFILRKKQYEFSKKLKRLYFKTNIC